MVQNMTDLGKLLIFLGVIIVITGVIFLVFDRIPGLGRLPGDILIKREGCTFYFPIMTCILVSIVISVTLWLLNKR